MSTFSRDTSGRTFGLPALFLICAMLGSCDQPKAEVPNGGSGKSEVGGAPKLEVVGGDIVDWGEVAPGILKKRVQLVNAGGGTLNIENVKASCGCTTAEPDKKALAAGDTANIDVSVDLANASGPQQKSLTITSNDAARPSVQVALQATLVRELTATPNMFPTMETPTVGKEFMTFVDLENTSQAPITISKPMIMEGISATVRFEPAADTTLGPGGKMRLVAHVKPLKAGPINAQVVVRNTSKSTPEMMITLATNVNG